jgi:hypothetical protein
MLTLEDNKNPIKTTENQNQLSERNQSIETVPPNRGLSERLMYTKIVRIHPGTTCACVKNCNKLIFYINTINRIDNQEPSNEKETPLFYVEEELPCSFCCFGECTFYIKFNIFDAITKELFSESSINTLDSVIDNCCGDNYIVYAPINNTKLNTAGISTINRHDSRSLYRTYEISEQSYYKIGEPYVEIEPPCCECSLYCFCSYMPIIGCCISCCKCEKSNNPSPKTSGCTCDCRGCCDCCCCCCCCCQEKIEKVEEIIDKRIYIDIFTMLDQSVGKFAYLFEKGFCCQSDKLFYEIYFPPDATEMDRLALIAQIIFFFKFRATGNNAFISLPGSRNNIEQFMS